MKNNSSEPSGANEGEVEKTPSLAERVRGMQTQLLVGAIVVVLLVIGLVITPAVSNNDTGLFVADRYDFSQNADALTAEANGFSYAYGTESNDDGSTLEDFVPASEVQIQEFIDTVGSDEEQFDDDEDRSILELIEFDQWTESGEVRTEVIEDYLNGEQSNE